MVMYAYATPPVAPAPGVETWISELEPCGTGDAARFYAARARIVPMIWLICPPELPALADPSAGSQGRSLPFSVRRGRAGFK
jgi:hypothetical protein